MPGGAWVGRGSWILPSSLVAGEGGGFGGLGRVLSAPTTHLPVADFMEGRGRVTRIFAIIARSKGHERITIFHGTEHCSLMFWPAARLMM